jgi:large subunit ribosomal protein L21
MYAIIRDGGRQFRVREGDVIKIDRKGLENGATVEFDQVLLCGGEGGQVVGQPAISGAKVTARVIGEVKGEKVITLKFRRRPPDLHLRQNHGHHQTGSGPEARLKGKTIARR